MPTSEWAFLYLTEAYRAFNRLNLIQLYLKGTITVCFLRQSTLTAGFSLVTVSACVTQAFLIYCPPALTNAAAIL